MISHSTMKVFFKIHFLVLSWGVGFKERAFYGWVFCKIFTTKVSNEKWCKNVKNQKHILKSMYCVTGLSQLLNENVRRGNFEKLWSLSHSHSYFHIFIFSFSLSLSLLCVCVYLEALLMLSQTEGISSFKNRFVSLPG